MSGDEMVLHLVPVTPYQQERLEVGASWYRAAFSVNDTDIYWLVSKGESWWRLEFEELTIWDFSATQGFQTESWANSIPDQCLILISSHRINLHYQQTFLWSTNYILVSFCSTLEKVSTEINLQWKHLTCFKLIYFFSAT